MSVVDGFGRLPEEAGLELQGFLWVEDKKKMSHPIGNLVNSQPLRLA